MRFHGPRTGGLAPKRFQALGICDSPIKAVRLYTIATKLTPGFPDANAMDLAHDLHQYWLDRFNKQLPDGGAKKPKKGEAVELLKHELSWQPIEIPPYEEPEDEYLFRDLVVIHDNNLGWFEPTENLVVEMIRRYNELDWTT